jgi:CyaY protein
VTDQEFRLAADEALERARRSLLARDDADDLEVELQNGVLQIEFEQPTPAKFVVSPNAPVQQIWVSAMARGYKLSWSQDASAFVLDGETLDALLARLVNTFLDG